MIGTLLAQDQKHSARARRFMLGAALLLPVAALVALSVRSIVRGAEAEQLVLAETYRQVAELVSNHLSHRLVEAEEYLVAELAAGTPDMDAVVARINDWERQQPGLAPMALVGPSGDLLRPLSVDDRRLELLLVTLPGGSSPTSGSSPARATTAVPRPEIAPVVLTRESGNADALVGHGTTSRRAGTWALDQRLDTVSCQLESKQYRLAASTALGALRYLIEQRFHLGESHFEDGFQRTQALLEAIPLDQRSRDELDELRQEASRLDGVADALRSLVTSLEQVPELGLAFEPPDVAFVAAPDRSAEAVAVAELPGTSMRLVHRLDPLQIETVMLEALNDSGPLSDAGVAVVDARGAVVAGEFAAIPADAALVALAAVEGWQVAAFPRAGSLAEVVRGSVRRNGLLLAGALAALAVGGTLGFRGLRREVAVSRMRADFVSSVSHELKTPLALLSASAENLRSGWVPEQRRGEYYETMMSEAQRLSHLVDNVLDFRRMEAGARSFSFRPVDLRDVIDEAVALYQMPAASAGIELEIDHADRPVIATVDHEGVHQVIANLLSNSVKYGSRQPRRIGLRLRATEAEAIIEIADNGDGVAAADLERVFEPFYRGTTEVAGSGIGLSIVRHVVAAHGGEINVVSTVGVGTTVTVRLPLDATRRRDRA